MFPKYLHLTLRVACSTHVAAVIIGLTTCLSGCATTFEEYPSTSANSCGYFRCQEGLLLGADPITSDKISRKYFGANLPGHGVLAIYVVVENQTSATTFLITPDLFSLSGQKRTDGAVGKQKEDTAVALGWVAAGLGSPVGALVASGIALDAKNDQANIRKKTLQSRTISPGQSTSGFVYFQVPKKTLEVSLPKSLKMEAKVVGSDRVEPVEVSLSSPEGAKL